MTREKKTVLCLMNGVSATRRIDTLTGAYMEQIVIPLADTKSIEDVEAYPWPDPDWYDYSKFPELIEQCGEREVNV